MSLAYCREIDGLRAIAVGAVVLYHAGVGVAGFVGVDVFFVISGYLITALLLREFSHTGRISLADFYGRRVRRIVPAAAVLVVATLLAAPLFLSFPEMEAAGRSALAASAFLANVFFQTTTGGYWDAASDQMPLLHLWSLSVEEQFYLLWPALLLVLLRFRVRLVPVLGCLAVASFVLAEYLILDSPQAAFYQMPARFWELAVGGIIAAMPAQKVSPITMLAGIVFTLTACVYPFDHFPGIGALPAVFGAGVVLAGVHGGATNRFLASRPMVGIGLISYSLYLWHWPLLAFCRASTVGEPSQGVLLALCALAVVLAALSYRYVEQPFRRARGSSGRMVAAGVAVSACLALSACAFGYGVKIAETANPTEMRALAAAADRPVARPPTGKPVRVAIWGDSFAWHWQPLAWAVADAQGADVVNLTASGCPPLMAQPGDEFTNCGDHNTQAAPVAAGMDTVVLVLAWKNYARDPFVEAKLAGTLDRLAKVRRVLLVGPTPVMADELPKCIRVKQECGVDRRGFEASVAATWATIARLKAAHPNVEVVDPTSYFCNPVRCPGVRNGVALYVDDSHVSASAVRGFLGTWSYALAASPASHQLSSP